MQDLIPLQLLWVFLEGDQRLPSADTHLVNCLVTAQWIHGLLTCPHTPPSQIRVLGDTDCFRFYCATRHLLFPLSGSVMLLVCSPPI